MTTTRSTTRRLATCAAFALVLAPLAGCGDDDSDDAAATGGTTAADSDVSTFCDAVVEAEPVVSAGPEIDFATASEEEIGAAIEEFAATAIPLLDRVSEATPDEVSEEMATLDAALRSGLETGDDPFADPAVVEAEAAIDRYMLDNCGYETYTVTGVDYAFEDAPTTIASGTVGLDFHNEGSEVHEMVLFRINDDVDVSVEELLELPEEEAMSKTQLAAVAFAGPGESAATFAELEPGRYVMLCFVPVGTTSVEGEPPSGPPHVMEGMVHELTVE